LREFLQLILWPPIEFCWNSSVDLVSLIIDGTDWRHLRQRLWARLMWIERFLESFMPKSFRLDQPVKTILLILLVAVLARLIDREFGVEDLKESGELIVITRESPTTLYRDGDQPAGPEYDYLKSYAEYLGVELRFVFLENESEVLDAISRGEGHIAAAGITFYPPLAEQGVVFGPGYQDVDIQVVCRRNHGKRPSSLEDMDEVELVVVADSGNEARLFQLQEDYPDLSWESDEDATVDDLLQMVWQKEIGCTVANSSEVNIKRRFYPELQVAFTIEEKQALAWPLSPQWKRLSSSIDDWLQTIESNGTLLILRDEHFNIEEFDYVDMRTYVRRIRSRLPALTPLFKTAGEKHAVPWTLLAAQAYQESHWNRRAKSPTGVRGIMMLTLPTAKEMGVKSRLDAGQSITGGAKYLNRLEKRIPEGVEGQDRWWYALAAYNVGMGHLHDARKLARKLDLDPDRWLDLKGVLPLLSQKKYYKNLKYGYARGAEPVVYVSQVRKYQNILHAQIARKKGIHAD
jgi:membrane-bound lytic murein transglycosylase F